MRVIDFESKLDKIQGAFVVLFARDGVPWQSYSQGDSPKQNLRIATCLMINRSDGAIGFVGGKVDPDETLEAAAVREVWEEVGYKIDSKLTPVVAHDIDPITTHLFALEMTHAELREIQKKAAIAEHFGSEVTGVFLPHLIDYAQTFNREGGITTLLRSAMALSVREEFIHFLIQMEIFDKAQLKIACDSAGYSLEKLLA